MLPPDPPPENPEWAAACPLALRTPSTFISSERLKVKIPPPQPPTYGYKCWCSQPNLAFLTLQLICAEFTLHFYLCRFLYQVNIFDINAEKSTFISISCSSSAAKVWGLAEWPVCWRSRVGGTLSPTLPSITTPCTILTNGVSLTRPWENNLNNGYCLSL